ncbi:Adenylyltransferase and sulfurtransferase uba4 [Sparassis crispa]|uniref:Needs CLA4 to survive protein 3 n=1 Tax=Sparassis crispa TaxID=139825 RepID=A0A401H230_9APHY|nr:Adenylyltransferase and sulfurtransferase uba4 [Sparassis crispa]GBE88449.1 Adenylyltransferase and sulfurtransferase uba4 [Sparassis crispa]
MAALPLEDYRRYGRQMVLDGFGLSGQLKLQHASVAVVGAGGLGCPALQYLAAAGVGRLAIIDHDVVELSNLQRQILHTERTVGVPKATSAAEAVKQINSRVRVDAITTALTRTNALASLAPYDIILDCTDNLPTRYLLSDTAVRLHRPLVSGAAQRFDGQLCTYNLGPGEGPCFRCVFPKPPAPEMTGGCEELGILGVITGIIGNLQALEAIKIITGLHDGKPSLLVFSALNTPPFRSIKLRARRPTCPACGNEGEKVGRVEETDYVAFCGGERPDWAIRGLAQGGPDSRIRATDLKKIIDSRQNVRIIDVRPRTEFGICHLPGSTNVPVKDFVANPSSILPQLACEDEKLAGAGNSATAPNDEVYFVCRLGNDSQLAAEALRNAGATGVVKDLVGGLRAWSRDVDSNFPVY